MPVALESAKVMSKGQVTIPKDIREKLNINEGDQIVFIYDKEKIIMMNSAVYAMKFMQDTMKDMAKKKGIKESDVSKIVKSVRK